MASKLAGSRAPVGVLEDLPNVGPAIAADLRALGIRTPAELAGQDPYALYAQLNHATGQRHDPCVLDTFIAAVRFVDGAAAKPWWAYTTERKRMLDANSSPLPVGNSKSPPHNLWHMPARDSGPRSPAISKTR